MFLRFLMAHNMSLADFGTYLLERGLIESDTYVLDLDRIADNAVRIGDICRKNGLSAYFMAKQIGHNPEVSRRVLAAGGFNGMVAVDFREAQILHAVGLPVSHLGHLCQVPSGGWDVALDMKPEVITLYSQEKAEELSRAAQKRGVIQNVLLRVRDKDDIFYQGQEGGFPLETLGETLDLIESFKGIRAAGVTSFPCFLFGDRKPRPTHNAQTVARGAAVLKERGFDCLQINMPSCNSPATIPMAAQLGATHVEPGHSLTGTNPDNLCESEPLWPSILYMSEVSHSYEGNSMVFAGGYYRRSNLTYALVKTSSGYKETGVLTPDPHAIDYYLKLSDSFPSGSPVCMAFRTQIFVTRSHVALVEGLSGSRPVLHSIWDAQGRQVGGGCK